jgi:sec-independent protein translocase protein TatA
MNLGPTELIIILVIVIIIFGVGRLGDVGSALGKSIKEFRKASTDEDEAEKPKSSEPTDAGKPSA